MGTLQQLGIPVFWAEGKPLVDPQKHSLLIDGLVEAPAEYAMEELRRLSTDAVSCRLTSVTRWSVRLSWEGILFHRLLSMIRPSPQAAFVKLVSHGGEYETTVRIEDLRHPRAVLAVAAEGEPLPIDYGGPVRAVFPQLWGYKSAKSVVRIAFLDSYERGYWESRGYADTAEIEASRIHDINAGTTRSHAGGEILW